MYKQLHKYKIMHLLIILSVKNHCVYLPFQFPYINLLKKEQDENILAKNNVEINIFQNFPNLPGSDSAEVEILVSVVSFIVFRLSIYSTYFLNLAS